MSGKKNLLQLPTSAVEELRRRIASKSYVDKERLENNNFLLRYLKFHHFDLSKAEKSLQNYCKYCKAGKKKEVLAIQVPPEYKASILVYGGAKDYQNRPVLQIPKVTDWKFIKPMDKNEESLATNIVKKMHWYIEKELLENDKEYAVIIVDLEGVPYTFSLAKKIFKICIDIATELMPISPDVIARCIIINAPRIVKILTAAGQSLMLLSQEQRDQCVLFSPGDTDWKEQVLKLIPKDQLRPEFGGTFTGYQVLH